MSGELVIRLKPHFKNIRFSHTLYGAIIRVLVITFFFSGLVFLIPLLIKNPALVKGYIPFAILLGLGGSGFSVFIGYLLYRNIKRGVDELNIASQRIANGHYHIQFVPSRFREFNQLFFTFRQLAETIQANNLELRQKKSWLTTILNSIQEGLLVLDPSGKILITNTSFQKMVGTDRTEDRFYWQVIRHPEMSDVITRLQPQGEAISREIELAGRHFLLNAVCSSTGDKVITFSDISEIVRVAEMKRDFIQNVSHELRTPLTAIKGYIETMEESVTGRELEYLNIIKRHTGRLIQLVNDLLVLSRLETAELPLKIEEISIRELITDVVSGFKPMMESKGLELKLDLPESDISLKGDRLYLEQAVVNLMDNAIRYTDRGVITVGFRVVNGWVELTIQDTGIGIPSEHLPRIFERFYVVDRARSRLSGGTGLGLAIVKHIVNLHNGKITVESVPGTGSRFTIKLPLTI